MKEELIQKSWVRQLLTKENKDSANAKRTELKVNDSLRIQLQHEQLKLNSLKKNHATVLLQKKDLEKAAVAADFKIARAKDYAEDLPSLKRYLISISRELFTPHKQSCHSEAPNNTVTECREKTVLHKRIKTIEEVANRKLKLHKNNMARMKQNEDTLSQQLYELETDIKYLRDTQAKVLLARKDTS